MSPSTYRKAIASAAVAGLLAGLAAAQAAIPDGITAAEWLGVAAAALAAAAASGGLVYRLPNAPRALAEPAPARSRSGWHPGVDVAPPVAPQPPVGAHGDPDQRAYGDAGPL